MARLAEFAFLALCVGACAIKVDSDADKNRPVAKVVNILKSMIAQLEKEGEEDEEVYQGMSCWCETNDEATTQAITTGEQRDNDLVASIEDLTANSARLNTEIENLNKEVAKNNEALDSATALRAKQLAEFNVEEKDMLQTLTSLKGAVVALSKHHEAAFLQSSESDQEMAMLTAIVTIQHALKIHAHMLAEVVSPHQRKVVAALSQTQNKQPQSGEIFGILKAMKESFETNIAQAQKDEAENVKGYNDLKSAKEEEIEAGKEQSDSKTDELASTDEKNAQSKQDLEDTRNTVAADTEYLANLKETCRNADQEYEERTKTRQLEIAATSKALEFLSSDEAHDLFTRTFNFVQLESTVQSVKRAQAADLLVAAANKSQDPRLSALATNVRARVNGMGGVKKTIQDMVEKLVQEKEDEIKHRDFCIEELGQNERDTTSKNRDKGDLEAKIDDLTMQVDELTRAIDDLKAAIADASLQLKHAGENREKANSEFQVVVADQRATQKLLSKALDILKGFYDKAALAQTGSKQSAGPPPPQGFKTYEKNEKSGGVMGMMEEIIADAKKMEEEATRDEEQAQKAYEEYTVDTNASLDAMNLNLTNKSGTRAKTEGDKVEAETEHEATVGELNSLASSNSDLHLSCDYTLKNFDLRQTTRDDEVEALKQSIAIFSGANFGAFLQDNKNFQ